MSFWSFLDAVFAPADADISTQVHSESHSLTSSMSSMSEPDWHNSFGTQADYQVPAESGDLFQSNDWSTFDGCGFGSGISSFDSDW